MKGISRNPGPGTVGAGLSAIVILAGGISTVHAATISYSDTWSASDSVFSTADSENPRNDSLVGTDTLFIPKFDPSLGTLNSVTFAITGAGITSQADATFRDDTWFSDVGGRQELYSMTVRIGLTGFSDYIGSAAPRLATCSDTGPLTGGARCDTNLLNSTYNLFGGNGTTFSAAILTAYTGAGTLAMSAYLSGWMYTNETDGDNGYIDDRYGFISSQGKLTITYNYTEVVVEPPPPPPAEVPEPATLSLLGAGLLGFGWSRSRRRRSGDRSRTTG